VDVALEEMLKDNPVFVPFGGKERRALVQAAIAKDYRDGEFVVRAGDVFPYLFLISQGAITALKESTEGRSLVVETFGVGEVFWGLALFYDDAPMPAALRTSADSQIYLWPRDRIRPLFLANGAAAWELSRLMIRRLLRASQVVEALAFQPVTGRVARLLLDQFPAGQDTAVRHLTLDEMAARVGTTREMVCRILYRFAEQGAIQINRTEFVFTDRRALEAQAQGGSRT
jgi:CRP-like cAMP-binding protein